jgi:tRNA-modifying protein YgfZ
METALTIEAQLRTFGAIAETDKPLRWLGVDDEVAHVRAGKSALAWLQSYTIIEFKGEEARTFLQGQLSNDVFALADGQAQWQGYCQPQGRLIAAFALVRAAVDHFWALVPSSIAPAIAKRLSMYVMRSKLKVTTSDDVALGLMGAAEVAGAASLLGGRALLKIPAAQIGLLWAELSKKMQPVSEARWQLAGIDAGIGEIHAGAQDIFVPQTIGWDAVGVNYKKGCYPGQEVVARAHYRGAVKRKPIRVNGSGAIPAPGQELIVAGESVGNFVCASETSASGGWVALASALPEARKAGDLALDDLGNARVELVGEA